MENERPKVGLGVIVLKDGQVLLGKRLHKDGSFSWCLPGGHLEYGESPEEAAIRETKEETGVTITNIRRGTYDWHINPDNKKHYLVLSLIADHDQGSPEVLEPHVFAEWQWFSFDQLPSPLYEASALFFNNSYNLGAHAPGIKPGIYRHYKGHYYRVIDVVRHTESQEDHVLYLSLYKTRDGTSLFVRPLSMFTEKIDVDGKTISRFTYISSEQKGVS